MSGKKLLCIVCSIIAFSAAFADNLDEAAPQTEDASEIACVITDCFSAAVASAYSTTKVSLPSCYVSTDSETGLPTRIAFFLTDPYEFQLTLKNSIGVQGNLLSALIKLFQNQQKDPLLSSVYVTLSSKNYQENKYVLNGYINVIYSEGESPENLASFLLSREYDAAGCNSIEVAISINVVYGDSDYIALSGTFSLVLDESGVITVNPVGEYSINDFYYQDVSFSF